MTPPDDLEEKVDLLLENIKLKEEIQKSKQKGKKRLVFGSFLLSVVMGASWWYVTGSKQLKAYSRTEANSQTSTNSTSHKIGEAAAPTTTLERLLAVDFEFPVQIEVEKERNSLGGEFEAVYVYDAGTREIHRFADNRHSVGKYTVDGAPKKSINYQYGGPPSFRLSYSGGYIVQVDNHDGTITTYSRPELKFVRRETGSLQDSNIKPETNFCPSAYPFKFERDVNNWIKFHLGDMVARVLLQEAIAQVLVKGTVPRVRSFTAEFIERCRTPFNQSTITEIFKPERHRELTLAPEGNNYRLKLAWDTFHVSVSAKGFHSPVEIVNTLVYEYFRTEWRMQKAFNLSTIEDKAIIEKRDGWFRGHLSHYIAKEIDKDKPTHYVLLNDAPSKFQANFDLVLPLEGWKGKEQGKCNLLPVLAFNKHEKVIIGGYICDDGSIEQHTRIPYDDLGAKEGYICDLDDPPCVRPQDMEYSITASTASKILDTALYENLLLLVERGAKKIKMIKLDF